MKLHPRYQQVFARCYIHHVLVIFMKIKKNFVQNKSIFLQHQMGASAYKTWLFPMHTNSSHSPVQLSRQVQTITLPCLISTRKHRVHLLAYNQHNSNFHGSTYIYWMGWCMVDFPLIYIYDALSAATCEGNFLLGQLGCLQAGLLV